MTFIRRSLFLVHIIRMYIYDSSEVKLTAIGWMGG